MFRFGTDQRQGALAGARPMEGHTFQDGQERLSSPPLACSPLLVARTLASSVIWSVWSFDGSRVGTTTHRRGRCMGQAPCAEKPPEDCAAANATQNAMAGDGTMPSRRHVGHTRNGKQQHKTESLGARTQSHTTWAARASTEHSASTTRQPLARIASAPDFSRVAASIRRASVAPRRCRRPSFLDFVSSALSLDAPRPAASAMRCAALEKQQKMIKSHRAAVFMFSFSLCHFCIRHIGSMLRRSEASHVAHHTANVGRENTCLRLADMGG